MQGFTASYIYAPTPLYKEGKIWEKKILKNLQSKGKLKKGNTLSMQPTEAVKDGCFSYITLPFTKQKLYLL